MFRVGIATVSNMDFVFIVNQKKENEYMIYLSNTRKFRKDCDENWLIVRSRKSLEIKNSPLLKETIWIPDLAPSQELFFEFKRVSSLGEFNQQWFNQVYVERFLNEMRNSQTNRLLLEWLAHTDKKIQLVCFCENETTCHRSILGGILGNLGAKVESTSGLNYLEYKL